MLRADAPARVLAEQTIDTAGKGPPYAFRLAYDPAAIAGSGRSVRTNGVAIIVRRAATTAPHY